MYTQLNQYHVVMEVAPEFWQNPDGAEVHLCASAQRPAGSAQRVHRITQPSNAPLAVNHQGQFPSVTLSFNLRPASSLGDAVAAIEQAEREIGLPARHPRKFPGHGRRPIQESLANEPLLIAAALITVYIVLGMLYESLHPSDHDSFDAPLGGRRRAAGSDDHAEPN